MKNNKLIGLTIADIHFGKKDDDKLYEQLDKYFFGKIKELKEDLDVVIIAGDLFHRIIKMTESTSVYINNFISKLIMFSEKYDFKIRIIKGTKTHDFNQLDNFKHLENGNFRIIQTVQEEEILKDVYFLYLPEEYIEDPDEYYNQYLHLPEGTKYDMIFYHGTLSHASFASKIQTSYTKIKNAVTFKTNELDDICYGKVLGGHIHIKDDHYCGSFTRFSYGEEKSKGFYEFEYDLKTLECKTNFIENKDAPTFVSIKFSQLKGDLNQSIEKIKTLKETYDNIRIIFDGDESDKLNASIETLKSFNDESIKIEVKKNLESEIDTRFLFILKKEFDTVTTIQKFIKIDKNLDINKKVIEEAIKPED